MKSGCQRSFAEYAATLLVSLLLYGVALVISLNWLRAGVAAPLKYSVALLPVLPALGILLATIRWCQSLDELQLRMQLESVAFGFAATAVTTFTYGFLQNAGLPEVSWIWIWPLMGVCLIVGQLVARWRYH